MGSVAVVVLASWPVWLVLIAMLLWVFQTGGCRRAGGGGWLWSLSPPERCSRWPRQPEARGRRRAHCPLDASGNLANKATGAAGLARPR